jgi:phosphoglycolate phosphatase
MIEMLTNILFDLDGTLTDPKEGITRCIRYSLDQFGVTPSEEEHLVWCIGPPLRGSFASLLDTTDDALLDQALYHYRERFSETGIFENTLYPGITTALTRIREAGFRIFLATSKPKVFAARILDYFELTQFFHAVHGSELDGRLADKGELVAHILAIERLDPEATLIVGDRFHDVVGGKKNAIMTAAVTYGYGSLEELADSQPDIMFDSPEELTLFIMKKKGLQARDFLALQQVCES